MGVLGELFPSPKISDEAGEPGAGEPPFRLGAIDLENNTVTVLRRDSAADGVSEYVGVDADADGD
ncbi:hypothetical protein [Pseudonocardia pini]|uniref:hypothetical protein n=1 Tax=Pseudonocardia pini TaxID=2758030 RepID=UPI0015F10E8C|nr:hypothetical protein [Pseudonocardia pini]